MLQQAGGVFHQTFLYCQEERRLTSRSATVHRVCAWSWTAGHWVWGYGRPVQRTDRGRKPLSVSSRTAWFVWTAAAWRGVQPLLSSCENLSLWWTDRSFRSFSLPGKKSWGQVDRSCDLKITFHLCFNTKIPKTRAWNFFPSSARVHLAADHYLAL